MAAAAAVALQQRLPMVIKPLCKNHVLPEGKMFGVLVVRLAHGRTGYLSAFSGTLAGQWCVDGFVPPVFGLQEHRDILNQAERSIDCINDSITHIRNGTAYQKAIDTHGRIKTSTQNALDAIALELREKKVYRHQLRKAEPLNQMLHRDLAIESRNDKRVRRQLLRETEVKLQAAKHAVAAFETQIDELQRQRKQISNQCQRRLFSLYRLATGDGAELPLKSLFCDGPPPSGAGDCAAIKLLHYANRHGLKPVCLAEFWWGGDHGLRRHAEFYAACRSRCRKILPALLRGVSVTVPHFEVPQPFALRQPETVFDDSHITVVNKPAGMLSVPGHDIEDSVEARLRQRFPDTDNKTLLLHRLDQGTSGLMIAAKNRTAYKALQQQFYARTIDKRYVAELDGIDVPAAGRLTLPMRVDLEDRPRQLVCYRHGKSALTYYKVITYRDHTTVIECELITGRTHQIRVHCAHPDGLNAPLIGDELYGRAADRMHLHAQSLAFTHPVSGQRLELYCPAEFI